MSFTQQQRQAGTKKFLGVLSTVPTSPVLGDEFAYSGADNTSGLTKFYNGEIYTWTGNYWQASNKQFEADEYRVLNNNTTISDVINRDAFVYVKALTANASVELPTNNRAGRKVTIHGEFNTGFSCSVTSGFNVLKVGTTRSSSHTIQTSGDSLTFEWMAITGESLAWVLS